MLEDCPRGLRLSSKTSWVCGLFQDVLVKGPQQSRKIELDDVSEVSSIGTIEPEETIVADWAERIPRGMELFQSKLDSCVYADYVSVCRIMQDNCIQYLEKKPLQYPCIQIIPDDMLPKSDEGLQALGLGLSFFETPTTGIVQRLLRLTSLDH